MKITDELLNKYLLNSNLNSKNFYDKVELKIEGKKAIEIRFIKTNMNISTVFIFFDKKVIYNKINIELRKDKLKRIIN